MQSFLNNIAAGAATAVLFLVGCVMAGIGLSVFLLLAMFGMAAFALALLASPLFSLVQKPEVETEEKAPEEAAA